MNNTPLGTLQVEREFRDRHGVLLAGVTMLRPDDGRPGGATTYVVPELHAQLQQRAGVIRPYAGVGRTWRALLKRR